MLSCGANDLGGALINESITRAAGAAHGQVWMSDDMRAAIVANGRVAQQRSTLYHPIECNQGQKLFEDSVIRIANTPAGPRSTEKYSRSNL